MPFRFYTSLIKEILRLHFVPLRMTSMLLRFEKGGFIDIA